METGVVNDILSERELQDQILAEAETYTWRVFHDNDSRRNNAGFPDLVLVKDGKTLSRGTADETDVGPSDAHLGVIGDKVYTVEEAEKLSEKIEAAIELTKNPDDLPRAES